MSDLANYIAIIVPSVLLMGIGGLTFGLLADYDHKRGLKEEVRWAQERLDAEEKRFRIGEIDRRNLQQ
jgi:hypothetical protein